jgi:hypothetical protein
MPYISVLTCLDDRSCSGRCRSASPNDANRWALKSQFNGMIAGPATSVKSSSSTHVTLTAASAGPGPCRARRGSSRIRVSDRCQCWWQYGTSQPGQNPASSSNLAVRTWAKRRGGRNAKAICEAEGVCLIHKSSATPCDVRFPPAGLQAD